MKFLLVTAEWHKLELDNFELCPFHGLIPFNDSMCKPAKFGVGIKIDKLCIFDLRAPFAYGEHPSTVSTHCCVHTWLGVLQQYLLNLFEEQTSQ